MSPTNNATAAHRSPRETSRSLGVDDIPTRPPPTNDLEETTSIAMAIMDQALTESDSHKKEMLSSIAKVMFPKNYHLPTALTDECGVIRSW